MAKRLAGAVRSSRQSIGLKGIGKACVEALEGRVLLAVTAGEYAGIRSSYPEFGLPADMASINIIEVTPDQLSVANLTNAITTAGGTTLPDLVVFRTTDTQNTITYASSADALSINIPSTKGAISIVGFGSRPLTIDAANQSRAISAVGASSATVNLGGMTLTRGYVSSGGGGGLYQYYGTLNVTNVTISGNSTSGGFGGGVSLYGGMLNLRDVTISGNTASSCGGGVSLYMGRSTLINVAISGNTASAYGGGIYQFSGTSELTNVTISGNASPSGYYAGGMCLDFADSTLRNSIVARNTAGSRPDLFWFDGCRILGLNTLIGNGSSQIPMATGIGGNLVGTDASPIDPQFVNMVGADWRTWDLRLQATSPAVNAGSNAWIPSGVTTDITGGARLIGGIVDMGAYEFDQAPTDILLSSSSIVEGLPSGSVVGTLSTTDPDVGDSFTYSLVSGVGSGDNDSFTISGNQLLTTAIFDYEVRSSYSIRVLTTDQGGRSYEKVFTIDVTDVDEAAPTVTAVYVRGSTWSSNYLSFLAANLAGSSSTYGYAIPAGSGAAQLQTLPWRNLNHISLRFSEGVSIAQAQFAMVGSVGSYSVSGFSYSSADQVATWSLSAAIGPDKLYVAVPGTGSSPVRDAAGNALDGEWTNPTSYSQVGATETYPSGDGVAGGNFAFRFDVLPGDSSGGNLGKVNVADALQTKGRSGQPVSTSTYRSDFDGNNLVNVGDVLYVKSKSSVYSLPVNPPVVPVFGSMFSQVSLLQRNQALTLW